MKRVFHLRFFFQLLLASLALLALIVVVIGVALYSQLPTRKSLTSCMTAKMYQVRVCPQQAGFVHYRDLPPHLVHALIQSEDANFWNHQGFDLVELQRSWQANREEGKIVRGGSTISQQLAKNLFLSGEKSYWRKFREALYTFELERHLSKKEILELYFNVVEFGRDVYGIRSGARFYFAKDPNELLPAESAFLVFLLPSPKKYSLSYSRRQLSPFARARLNVILQRLFKTGKLSEQEFLANSSRLDFLFGGTPMQFTPEELREEMSPDEMDSDNNSMSEAKEPIEGTNVESPIEPVSPSDPAAKGSEESSTN